MVGYEDCQNSPTVEDICRDTGHEEAMTRVVARDDEEDEAVREREGGGR